MTLAACAPESHSDFFVRSLNNAQSYLIKDGKLAISLKQNAGTMTFSALGAM
jgi:hypothetical protein